MSPPKARAGRQRRRSLSPAPPPRVGTGAASPGDSAANPGDSAANPAAEGHQLTVMMHHRADARGIDLLNRRECLCRSVGRSAAAAFSSTCAGRRAPGMAHDTSDTSGSSAAPSAPGSGRRHQRAYSSNGLQARGVIHAGKGLAAIERFPLAVELAVSSAEKWVSARILPVSMPEESGTRVMMPTSRRAAWPKNTRPGAGGTG